MSNRNKAPEGWSVNDLGTIANFQKGFAFKSQSFVDIGIKVVKVSNLTIDSIDIDSCIHIDYEEADVFRKYELIQNDIIISTVGSWPSNPASVVGKVVRVPQNLQKALLNQNAVRVRSSELCDQVYLYYNLKNNVFSNYIVGTAQGAANQASITQRDIKSYKIILPPLLQQKKIASILSTLDEKININNQINKKLEEVAQALFKQWIIDFNFPDENGTPYKDSGSAMIDSELGNIPKNWSVVELNSLIILNKGKSYKSSELANSGLPMVNLKCFGRNHEFRHDGIKYFVGQYKDNHIVKGNDLVISMTDVTQQAEIIANVLMIPNYLSKSIISLDVSSINSTNEKVSNYFLYYLLKTNMFRDFAKGYASGTTVLHLNKNGVLNYKFVLPDSNTLKQISDILKDIIIQKDTNIAQNAVMTNIRDSLLPKLMSGEIDVTHGV